MRILRKYTNRRLYDTSRSCYITLEDVKQLVLNQENFQVQDSKTGADLARNILLQIISEQEALGHGTLLTNQVLQQLIRFYGDSMQGMMSQYMEQGIVVDCGRPSGKSEPIHQNEKADEEPSHVPNNVTGRT